MDVGEGMSSVCRGRLADRAWVALRMARGGVDRVSGGAGVALGARRMRTRRADRSDGPGRA